MFRVSQSKLRLPVSIPLTKGLLLVMFFAGFPVLHAATFLWDGNGGAGADSNWGTANNWNPNTAPTAGGNNQDLQFAGSSKTSPNANGGTAWEIRKITFNSGASPFTLGGTTIDIGSGGIINNSSNSQTINNLLDATANQSWAATSGALVFDAVTISTATLTLTGSNAITLGSNNGVGSILTNSAGNRTLRNNASGAVTIYKIDLSNDATNRTLDIDGSGTTTVTNTISNGVSSAASKLSYSGTGKLILQGTNTYDGTTAVTSGTLTIQNGSALGSATNGTTISNGATLELEHATGMTISGETLTLSGTGVSANGALNNVSGSNTWTGNIGLAANTKIQSDAGLLTISGDIARSGGTNRAVVFDGSGDITVSGAIAGTVTTLTKNGSGVLTLSNASNAYSGATTITAGTLALSGSGVIPTTNLVLNGGVLATRGTFSRALGTGSNQVQFGAAGGGFAAYGGALSITGFTGTPTWGMTNRFLPTGGALIFGSAIADNVVTWTNNFSLGTAARTITVDDNINTTADYANISGMISGGAGGGITKNGAGLLVLSGSNTYTGATLVSAGTLNLQNNNALGTGTAGTTVSSGAALELQGGITAANGTLTLNGTGDGGNGALRSVSGANAWNNSIALGSDATITSSASGNLLTIGNYTANTVAMGSNTLTADGAGDIKFKANVGGSGDTGGFIKNGSGTTTFNGDGNFYTGTTSVNAGTLVLDTLNNAAPDNAILGNLVIGAGGPGGADSVIVRYGTGSADNKIANTSQVTVNSDGKLDLNNRTDTIGSFVFNGGHVDSGSGLVTLNGDVTTNVNAANRTALIDGHLDLGGATRTFTVANGGLASDLTVNAVINGGSLVKAGTGTMTITSDNTIGYGGTTLVSAGVLNIQDSNALGQHSSSDPAKGTTVATGAALQLQKNLGNLTIGAEFLTLNGSGINNDGALRNVSGNNSWGGTVTLGSNARINSDAGSLSISGDFTGTSQNLTMGGVGDATLSGAIGTGTGGLVKDGSGTLTLSGGTTSTFTGGVTVNDGTIVLNKTAGLNATGNGAVSIGDNTGGANTAVLQLNQNEQIANAAAVNIKTDGKFDLNGKTETIGSLTGSGTLAIGSGSLIVGDSTSTSFSGSITGTGSLTKQGSGTLTIASNVSIGGSVTVNAGTLAFTGSLPSIAGTLTLGAGSTLLLDLSGLNHTLTVDTIHITGNTVIDFGSGSASILNVNTFIIDAGVTLVSITDWGNTSDFFFAQAWSGATLDTRGAGTPETQVTFSGYLPSQTAWLSNDPSGFNQITPAPEPATYGLILMGAGIALVGYRRHLFRKKRSV